MWELLGNLIVYAVGLSVIAAAITIGARKSSAGRPGPVQQPPPRPGRAARKPRSKKIHREGWEDLPRVLLAGDYGVEVVGESYSKEEIRRIDTNDPSGLSWDPVRFTALLVPEPDNPYDSHATVVCVPGVGAVGHIGREDRETIQELRSTLIRGGRVAEVEAKLTGGWGDDDDGDVIPPGIIVFLPKEPRRDQQANAEPATDVALPENWQRRPQARLSGKKLKEVNAVGEYPFQDRLRSILEAALKKAEPATFEAVLVPIPLDHDEVKVGLAVCNADGPVGRVSVATAKSYRLAIADLSDRAMTATCEAYVFTDGSRIEVKLRMPNAAEAEAAVAATLFD